MISSATSRKRSINTCPASQTCSRLRRTSGVRFRNRRRSAPAWLVFEPLTAALRAGQRDRTQVTTLADVRARTRIVVGEKPAAANTPLPQLNLGEATSGFRVPFDVELPYAEASQLATEEFGHRTYKVQDGLLVIEDIRIGAGSAGRVSLTADVRTSRYDGPLTLEGTPRFDPVTRTVTVPDLDYSVETRERSLFFRIGERLAHEGVRDRLRESSRWPLKDQIALITGEINSAMNRQISPSVTLRGQVAAIEPQRVTPVANTPAVVRVTVSGNRTD